MSAAIYCLYLCEYSASSSASSWSIEEKSASPTPIIITAAGKFEPLTISSIDFCMSLMIPSVMMTRTWNT